MQRERERGQEKRNEELKRRETKKGVGVMRWVGVVGPDWL
jgi:hypothetical protein